MENDREERIVNAVSQQLENVLNRQGYSFQYSLLNLAEELRKQSKSNWILEATEFPININNEITHIDFICTYRSVYPNRLTRLILVAECKRVDPAKGYWCFAKTPYTWTSDHNNSTQFDQIRCFSEIPQFTSSTKVDYPDKEIMNLGLEIKTGKKGDGTGNDRKSNINTSISQVSRGSSGFINYLCNESKDSQLLGLKVDVDYIFIPAVFTTARIFVTDANLGSADLEKGYLPKDSVKAEEKDWIWFNHNRSESLSHNVRFNYENNNHLPIYYREFTRSIAIVGPKGFDNFLKYNFEDRLRY
jgi:hypothetical protein